ncbi:tol-pal system protein YbgF [Candidatus Poribacteria bacterium]|nr:tol-pal system protein YbgF [Candidatus Poribacteria bacterium]
MSHPSKAWFAFVCLLSYFFMGQAGCQTASEQELGYIRSDIVRMRRDVEEIKQSVGPAASSPCQDLLKKQAAQRETLIALQEGQQQIDSKLEETRHELTALKQEITNLKLNMYSQMDALKAMTRASSPPRPPEGSTPPEESSSPVTQPAAPENAGSRGEESVPSESVGLVDYTKLYDTAYEDYVRQNYPLARNGFEEYLKQYPDTDLADNAQYWIGECYYAEGKYEEAVGAFNKVITRYPTGNKVPRAMLKSGYALVETGKKDEARKMFQKVLDAYPLSSEADQAKAKLREMK